MAGLELRKPICFFDLETTGTNLAKDRIVEIAVLKIFPNGDEKSRCWRVNPEMPIPPEATAVHGITDHDVAQKPTFKQIASEVFQLIRDSDLGGFNSDRFDIPLLAEELLRAELDFDRKHMLTVDVQTIFHKMEKRNLSAAYKFYCDKELVNAHSAEADTRATYEVLLSQLDRYPELARDVSGLSEFSSRHQALDYAGHILEDEQGRAVFGFGKFKGVPVEEVFVKEPGYYGWMLQADFPLYTKKVLTQLKLKNR